MQKITITLLCLVLLFDCTSTDRNQKHQLPDLKIYSNKGDSLILRWNTSAGKSVLVKFPVIAVGEANNEKYIPLKLVSHQVDPSRVIITYGITIPVGKDIVEGTYVTEIELAEEGKILLQNSKLNFQGEVRKDVTVISPFHIINNKDVAFINENMKQLLSCGI